MNGDLLIAGSILLASCVVKHNSTIQSIIAAGMGGIFLMMGWIMPG